MAEPTEQINTYRKEINLPLGREIDHTVSGNSQIVSLSDEWQKLLLHTVNVNVCGNNIHGVLTHVWTDHIILVVESHVYIIPSQHVAYISYNI